MSFQELMLYLQENSFYGIIISASFVVITYILVSVLIIVSARKKNLDFCTLGVVPILQLGVSFLILKTRLKEKSIKRVNGDIEIDLFDSNGEMSEDEEIEF